MAGKRRLVACILMFVTGSLIAQESSTYRDTAGGREISIRILQDPLPGGLLIRSFMSDGEYHEVEYGAADATVRYRVTSPVRKLDYTVRKEGNLIRFEGTLGGRPLSRTQRIDDRPWYQTIEKSLSGFARSGGRALLLFWIVQPWEARAYLMQAANEGEETVVVGSGRTSARRVRVSPAGLLSLFWSTLYWYRSSDGLFVRYEGVRGLPGTPLTVVELVDVR
jgi:hypothetical protein